MTIFTTPGYPGAVSVASGGKVYSFNDLNTTPETVAPANPSRQTITFHNPGSVDIFVAPAIAFDGVSGPAPTPLTPDTSTLGGCFRVFANGGFLIITGECQGAWQAFAASSSDNPFTVMDSNV